MSCDGVRRLVVGGWFVAAVGLFAYVMTRQPIASIGDACLAMGPAVLLAPAIAATWIVTRSALLASVLGGRVAWQPLIPVRAIGDGYNALVPAAGLAGEPLKLRRLLRWMSAERALAALVRDRLVDNALGLVVSAAGIAIGIGSLTVPGAARGALWVYCAVAGPVGLVMLAVACTRLPARLGGVASRWTRAARHAPEPLPLPYAVRAIGWGLATRGLQLLETALLLRCIGAPVSVATVAVVDGVLNAAGFVGFVLPQGLGVVEGAALYVLTGLGSPAASATAFALARRGRVLVIGALGIGWHLATNVAAWLRPGRVTDVG